ncbi:MAG TPA: hypothetical protein VF188_09965 [Longimicrobiales bacterium]
MRHRYRPLLAAMVAVTAACDIPTEPPKWETMWIAPLTRTEVPIGAFLPSRVRVTEDRSEFRASVAGADLSTTLAELCGTCGPLHGARVPKPGFAFTIRAALALPRDLLSVSMAAGEVVIDLTNGLGFDPVRPGGAARGRIVSTVMTGGTVLAADTLDGEDEAFPTDATTRFEIPWVAATIKDAVVVSIHIESPAGDSVRIDTSRVFGVEVFPFEVGATEVVVRFAAKEITTRPVELDVAGVDPNFTTHARRGAFVLDIMNPFSAGGTFSLEVATPQMQTTKPFVITPGEATQRIDFTGEELRGILGRDSVVLSATGVLSSSAGLLTLRPQQSVMIGSRIELVVGPEGG